MISGGIAEICKLGGANEALQTQCDDSMGSCSSMGDKELLCKNKVTQCMTDPRVEDRFLCLQRAPGQAAAAPSPFRRPVRRAPDPTTTEARHRAYVVRQCEKIRTRHGNEAADACFAHLPSCFQPGFKAPDIGGRMVSHPDASACALAVFAFAKTQASPPSSAASSGGITKLKSIFDCGVTLESGTEEGLSDSDFPVGGRTFDGNILIADDGGRIQKIPLTMHYSIRGENPGQKYPAIFEYKIITPASGKQTMKISSDEELKQLKFKLECGDSGSCASPSSITIAL